MRLAAAKQYFSMLVDNQEVGNRLQMSKRDFFCTEKTDFFLRVGGGRRTCDAKNLPLSASEGVTGLIQLDIYDRKCSQYN